MSQWQRATYSFTYYIELKNANVISGLMADKGASVAAALTLCGQDYEDVGTLAFSKCLWQHLLFGYAWFITWFFPSECRLISPEITTIASLPDV